MTRNLHIFVLAIAALCLSACSSTVVRTPSRSVASPPAVSQPKYGATIVVQKGDNLYRTAVDNGITPLDLALWNGIAPPYTIYPGQRLRLYPQDRSAPPSVRSGATVATQRPAVSTPTASSGAASANTRPAPPPTPAPAASDIAWRWPADGQVVGRYVAGDATKQGIDIAGKEGQPVRAAADGVVVYSGAGLVGYGELVIVKHSETWLSAYGHNRRRLVNEGQNVKAGQQIAEMGHSGAARDMLHFEIRYNGKPVDPQEYLPKR